MTDTTDMTPVGIDRFLYDNYQRQMALENQIKADVKTERSLVKKLGDGRISQSNREHLFSIRDRITEAQEARSSLIRDSVPYVVEYNRRRWNRYFLVTNTHGHVHRNMDCPTCFRDTSYAWLVDLADCDEGAMIEEWGERACTVCFPDAPTHVYYHRPARVDREAQAEREAEKAARQAAKDVKAIKDVDGRLLVVDGYPIRTKVAARNALSQAFQNLAWYGEHPSDFEGQIRKLVPALQAAGIDWVPVAERAIKKVHKEMNQPNPYAHLLTVDQKNEQMREQAVSMTMATEILSTLKEVN